MKGPFCEGPFCVYPLMSSFSFFNLFSTSLFWGGGLFFSEDSSFFNSAKILLSVVTWMDRTPLHASACRIPSGHPEGYLEAFANVYRFAYDDMVKRATGEKFERKDTIYPNVYDGLDGMNFITQCVASSGQGGDWLSLKCDGARR